MRSIPGHKEHRRRPLSTTTFKFRRVLPELCPRPSQTTLVPPNRLVRRPHFVLGPVNNVKPERSRRDCKRQDRVLLSRPLKDRVSIQREVCDPNTHLLYDLGVVLNEIQSETKSPDITTHSPPTPVTKKPPLVTGQGRSRSLKTLERYCWRRTKCRTHQELYRGTLIVEG